MRFRAPLAELVGTFIFFFIAAGSVATDAYTRGGVGLVGVALAHGLVLAMLISALGAISGGHFNPAVTIAFALTGRVTVTELVSYVVAQLIGAAGAGLLLRAIFAQVFPEAVIGAAHLGTPALARDVSFGTGILIEAVLTFILLTAIYGSAVDPRAPRTVAGFAIGFTVMVDILMGGPLTGAAMNPARAFGPALGSEFWDNHLVYWIGPILGAVVAAFLYEYLFMERVKRETALDPPDPPETIQP